MNQIYNEFGCLIKNWIVDMLFLTRANKEKLISLNEINVSVNCNKLFYNEISDIFEGMTTLPDDSALNS
jgi:hypothetical protein